MCSLHKDLDIRALEIHKHPYKLILEATFCLEPYYQRSLLKLSVTVWMSVKGQQRQVKLLHSLFMQLVEAVSHIFEKLSKLVSLQARGHRELEISEVLR